MPDLTHSTSGGRGCFRSHGGAQVNTVRPIKRFMNERHRIAAAAAENDRADWHASAFFDIGIDRGIVAHWRGEPAVRMRSFLF